MVTPPPCCCLSGARGVATYRDGVMPRCDIDYRHPKGMPRPEAYADARIPGDSWAFLCHECFHHFGCVLGIGHGQMLVEHPRA
jgi:hypothetical protein